MTTTCERCGALLRPGRSPAQCEHCRDRTSPTATAGSEDSGLIDIRMMTKMLGGPAIRPLTPVPTFGGLAPAAPGLLDPPVRRPPAPLHRPSQTPLHVLLGVLIFGVVGLAGAVVHSATRTPDTAPTWQTADATSIAPTRSAEHDDKAGDKARDVETKPAAPAELEPVSAEDTADKPLVAGRRAQPRPVVRPARPELATPRPGPVATPPTTQADPRESVACLLDLNSCGPKRETSPTPTPTSTAATELPAKLEPADISDGTRAAKASAMSRCSPLAKGGETVKIKLSITGPTGAVLGASSESDAGNPSLATCCASELKAAQFKSVQKAQIGAVVTLKF